jgi:hypothetical protein
MPQGVQRYRSAGTSAYLSSATSPRSTNAPQHVEAKHVVICQPCNRKYKSQSAIDQHWRSSTAHPNCPVCGAGAADTPALAEVSFDRLPRPICLEHPLILGVTSTSRMPIRKYAVAACFCTRAIWTHTILRRATTPRAGRVASALQPSWNMPRYAGHATTAPRKLMLTSGLRCSIILMYTRNCSAKFARGSSHLQRRCGPTQRIHQVTADASSAMRSSRKPPRSSR